MICSKCGTSLNDDAVYCSTCGTRLKEEQSANKEIVSDGENRNEDKKSISPKAKELFDKVSKSRKALICTLISIVGIIIVIAIAIHIYNSGFWGRIVDQMLDEYPYANNAVASDGSYLEIDTNYYDKDINELTAAQATTFYQQQEDSLYGIKFVNEKLGFPNSVFEKMLSTTSLMGRQTEETAKYRVSWTYHPDRGLEAMYEKK